MGMLDQVEMADAYGVPSYFVTEILTEAAGGGCVRLFGCVRQRGVLVPQYMVVMPHQSMLDGAEAAAKAAREVANVGLLARRAH